MIKRVETNDCEIRITARSAGDFGFVRMSGIERTAREEYRLCEEIVSNIKRHVDDIGWTYIEQKGLYETEDGEQFETLYDALAHLYDEYGCVAQYEYRHHAPNQQYGTRGRAKSFEDLIVAAYQEPHNFEVIRGELSPEQQKFLTRVIDAALDERMKKEETA